MKLKQGFSNLIGLFIIMTIMSCSSDNAEQPKNKLSIRLATATDPVAWLSYIAIKKNFFSEQGLNVEIIKKPSGKRALKAMLNNEADYCIVSEVPLAFQAFKTNNFKILSTIGSADNEVQIIARKNHGINKPTDLAGKKLATQKNSAIHFFLSLFLTTHNLENKTHIEFYKIENLATELNKGTIDAISTREPFLSKINHLLGGNAIIFKESDLYRKSYHLVGMTEAINKQPDAANRLLKAHLQANQWLTKNLDDASQLISSNLKLDQTHVKDYLTTTDFSVRLDQSLVQTLENVGQWAINNEFVETKELPNYINTIQAENLNKINPTSVNLIF